MIAIVRRRNVVSRLSNDASIFAPFWYVNFKLKIGILKIKARVPGPLFILSLSIIKHNEIEPFNYFL